MNTSGAGTAAVASDRHWPLPIGSDQGASVPERAGPLPARGLPTTEASNEHAPGALPNAPEAGRGPERWPRLPRGAVDTWPVQFTGSIDVYATLWWRCALWTLLTAGLYLPWARIRCRRYLLQHTRVAGQTLDYHGSPWPMLVRQCLAVALAAGAMLAAQGSAWAGLLAGTLALACWPLLLWMGELHAVNRTSWGRRPLALVGGSPDAYRVLGWPMLGVAALGWGAWALMQWLHAPSLAWVVWGTVLGVWVATLPTWVWGWLHLRQGGGRIGPLRLHWRAKPHQVAEEFWQAVAWSLLWGLLLAGVSAVALGAMQWLWGRLSQVQILWVGGLAAATWALGLHAQLQARMHRLAWGRTGHHLLRLRSQLSVRDHLVLRRRHVLLLLLTCGVFWPWAKAEAWEVRAHATAVQMRIGLRTLTRRWPMRLRRPLP